MSYLGGPREGSRPCVIAWRSGMHSRERRPSGLNGRQTWGSRGSAPANLEESVLHSTRTWETLARRLDVRQSPQASAMAMPKPKWTGLAAAGAPPCCVRVPELHSSATGEKRPDARAGTIGVLAGCAWRGRAGQRMRHKDGLEEDGLP